MAGIALQLSEEKLSTINTEIEGKVGGLVTERDELMKEIKKLQRGSGGTNGTPAFSDEKLVETVATLTKGGDPASVTSPQIAGVLGVDSRSIARRLSKLAADGSLKGDKEKGYSAV